MSETAPAVADPTTTTIKPEDKVPFGQKIAYATGTGVDLWAAWLFLTLVFPIYNMELKMNPGWIGLILLIYRLWDAVTDPIMGSISDNTRTRWGRRRPYLLIGGLLTGLTFPLLWWIPDVWIDAGWFASFVEDPADQANAARFVWLVIAGVFFYTCFTVYNMPYQSLILEMTPDYNERTRVTAFRSFAAALVGLTLGWAWWTTQLPVFADPVTNEPDAPRAMRIISVILGVIMCVCALMPAIFVRERYYEADLAKKQKKVPILRGIKETLSNGPFVILTALATMYMFGILVVDGMANYLSTYYVLDGDKQEAAKWLGIGTTITTVTGLLGIPIFSFISEKIGKNKALGLAIAMITFGSASSWFIYVPGEPAWMMIYYLSRGMALNAVWLLIPSMQADVVDHDELATGERREGAFAAIFSWMLKMGLTAAFALQGPILNWTGFDIELENNQPDEVIQTMRVAFLVVPTVALLMVGVLLYLFPLTPRKSAAIRQELEERRGKV
ncbi:MAG: MFS transporter [Planctomycetota bacterium]